VSLATTAIVGGGPQGLACAAALATADPTVVDRLVVYDPGGQWLRQWDRQFAKLEIPHLRSPGVHHPGPDAHELSDHGHANDGRFFTGYGLPGTQTFRAYCRHLIDVLGLDQVVRKATVTGVTVGGDGRAVVTSGGDDEQFSRVVLAINGGSVTIPRWATPWWGRVPREVLRHAGQVDLRSNEFEGERVLIVGGGLTSAHLVEGLVSRKGRPVLVARRDLEAAMFDSDPGWMGPRNNCGTSATTQARRSWGVSLYWLKTSAGVRPTFMSWEHSPPSRWGRRRGICTAPARPPDG